MAKKKKLADTIRKHTAVAKKSLNPFEIHVNKQRFQVIGQKSKSDHGLPGISRAKAIKKRKRTLLPEYQIKGKVNKFLDMRIGERNSAMTPEDRIIARFTAERMKSHRKKSIFNLADDEVLTHHGQTLSEIEKFDDPRSDSEDEDNSGKLGAEFVEDAHFGGGILTKTSEDGAVSRKDVIQQLIADSKKRKAEKQRAREETLQLTEKLDTEWRELLPIVSASKKGSDSDAQPVEKADDYDKIMVELKFQARAKPSDRLKSEEEIIQEEKERLEKLEEERIKRMKGITEEKVDAKAVALKHRSADDLDDGFDLDSDPEPVVAYNEKGELIGDLESLTKDDNDNGNIGEDSIEANKSSQEESEDESEDESSEEEDDSMSDLKSNSESEDDHVAEFEKCDNLPSEVVATEEVSVVEKPEIAVKDVESIKSDLLARKKMMEQARKELPYTFEIPENYEEFQKLFCHQSPEHQAVIAERMLKCNHPKLQGTSKEKLANLFTYFLQHLNDISTDINEKISGNSFHVLDRLAPFLFDLAHWDPENAHFSVIEVIKEKQDDYKKQKRRFPHLDVLLFLKLISLLFPTSDFRHPVVTPTFIFMTQMLVESRVKSKRDVSVGLFISTLFLEYTDLSKRFPPNAIYFLHKIIKLAIKPSGINKQKVFDLTLTADASCLVENYSPVMNIADLFDEPLIDDNFKIRAFHTCVKLLNEFHFNLESLPSCYEIFCPVCKTLSEVDISRYPKLVEQDVHKFLDAINIMKERKLLLLVREKKRPKALRLYEPKIVPVFDGEKKRPVSKNSHERSKLVHKFKREMKGALREIRRDNSFLTKLKLKDTLRNDMERKSKVREIFGQAAMQQAELKKFKKKK